MDQVGAVYVIKQLDDSAYRSRSSQDLLTDGMLDTNKGRIKDDLV